MKPPSVVSYLRRIFTASIHDLSISRLPISSLPSPRCSRTKRISLSSAPASAASLRNGTDMNLLSFLPHRYSAAVEVLIFTRNVVGHRQKLKQFDSPSAKT